MDWMIKIFEDRKMVVAVLVAVTLMTFLAGLGYFRRQWTNPRRDKWPEGKATARPGAAVSAEQALYF